MKVLSIVFLIILLTSHITFTQSSVRSTTTTPPALWVAAYYPTFAYCDLLPQQIDYKAITHLIIFGSEPSTTYPYMREMVNATDSATLETGVPGWCYNPASNNNTNGITHQSIMRDSCRANGVKFILCLGGEIGTNANNMNAIIADSVKQDAYIAAVMGYVNRHGFNGIDIDLEYPVPAQKALYGRFLRKFRVELDKMNPRGVLSMAVDKFDYTSRMAVSDANATVDQINIMQYGMGESQYSGYNAPMARPNVPNYTAWTIADHGPALWKSLGYDSTRIGMLIPFECKYWTGVDGPGQLGGGTPSFTSYIDVLNAIKANTGSVPIWDAIAKVPGFGYTTGGVKHWYSYEDSNSIPIKVQYARDQHIGGVGVWELWRGWIKNNPVGQRDPLLQSLKKAIGGFVPQLDTTKPTVSIIAPSNGATVSGIVTITANASDNVGVTQVDFKVNGSTVGTDVSFPYSYSWNATALTGSQTLSAVAYDAAGNQATSSTITVTVVPPPPVPDTTKPTVSISAPLDGATVSGTVLVSANASDNIGVTKVDFKVNGVTVGTDVSLPFSYSWNTTGLSGSQTLSAVAYDSAGNQAASLPVAVTVNPSVPPPPPPDSIPSPAMLRDNFNRADGQLPGTNKWAPIVSQPNNGSMAVVNSAVQTASDSGNYNFGGVVWDTLMSGGTEANITVRQKSGNTSYTSLFMYARMNSKNYNTATGYRLRYLEQSGTDAFEIQRVTGGYSNSTSIASASAEVNPGDVITFRVLNDNVTMAGYVNGVRVIEATDSTYKPQQWYMALRSCVFPTPVRFDDFMVSTKSSAGISTPALLTPVNNANGQSITPTLAWTASTGAINYRVQVATDSVFVGRVFDDSTITSTSVQVPSLLNNTKYYWRVNAKDSITTSAYSTVWNFTTLPIVPSSPTLLSPSNHATGQPTTLILNWNASSGASSYRVQVATDSLFSGVILDDSTVASTSRQASSLSNNTTYYWRVNAKNSGGTSAYSAVWNLTTIPAAPSPPILLSPTNQSSGQPTTLTLSWSASGGAVSYRVQVATDSLFGGMIVNDSTVTSTTRQVGPLSNGTQYYWRVNAKNSGGTSAYSAARNFTTIPSVPSSPVLLSPTNQSTNQPTTVMLSWNVSGGAALYRVQVAIDSSFSGMIIDDSTVLSTTKQVGSLSNSTTYYWRVSAKNIGGTSAFSSAWRFTTIIAPPSSPLLVAPTNGAVNQPATQTLNWNSSTGATTYRCQVATDSFFSTLVVNDSALTSTSWQVGPLSGTTLYYWRVNASNAGGASAYSSIWNFTTVAAPPSSPILAMPSNNVINQPTTLTLSWNTSSGAVSYHVQVATDSLFGGLVTNDSTVTTTSRQVGSLSNNMTYYWRVNAKSNGGTSAYSSIRRFSTIPAVTAPPSPVLVSPLNGSTGQATSLTLMWNVAAGATSYHVQLALDSLFSNITVDDSTLTDTTKQFASLTDSTQYYWRVNAKNSGGASGYSPVATFYTASTSNVLIVDKNNLDFGRVGVGASKRDSVSLRNLGHTAITITNVQSSNLQYSANMAAATIAPGANQKMFITFTPNQKALISGLVISICDSFGLVDTVFVTGKGVTPARNQRHPGSIMFTSVPMGSSITDSFTVVNSGELDLSISNVQLTNPSFSITPTSAVIAPAESLYFYLTATASSSQSTSGYIIFSDNADSASDSMLVQIGSVSGVDEKNSPTKFSLQQNYPNPFNPTTTIMYTVPVLSRVTLRIFNVLGQEVRTLVNDVQDVGVQTIRWNSTDNAGNAIPSGVYYYRIQTFDLTEQRSLFTTVRKMILLN